MYIDRVVEDGSLLILAGERRQLGHQSVAAGSGTTGGI